MIKIESKFDLLYEFLNPIYEAKCVKYLENGDTLYVVAK